MNLDRFQNAEPPSAIEVGFCQACGDTIYKYELRNCPECGKDVHEGCIEQCKCGHTACRKCLVQDENLEWHCREECLGE